MFALAVVCGVVSPAEGGDPPIEWNSPETSTEARLDTLRVEASRPTPEEQLRLRPGAATWVPLGAEAPAGRDLADLLDRTAGVQVHRAGGFGSYSVATVRGSTAGQVKVCLDGVPLSNASEGAVDLALVPLASLDHAAIYRGPEVESFGGPPAAGVIDLVTPAAVSIPFRGSIAVGSFGSRAAQGTWGRSAGAWSAIVAGGNRRSDGDFPYLDRHGTLHGNTADDSTVARANNDFEETSVLGKFGWDRVQYALLHLDRESGIPGPENLQTTSTRFRYARTRHQVVATREGRSGWGGALSAHREDSRDRFENPDGEVGLVPARSDARLRDRGARARAGWSGMAGLPIGARLSAEWGEERRRERDLLRSSRESHDRATRTWIAEGQVRLGRLVVRPSYRWLRVSDDGTPTARFEHVTWSGSFALPWGLQLEAARGRSLRVPTFPELFGLHGIQDGNERLRPERGVQWDAGLLALPRRDLRFEAVYFERLIADQIALLQNSQRTVKAQNVDRAWVRGVEGSFLVRWERPSLPRVTLDGAWTWQEAEDVGRSRTYRGKRLPNRPEREGVLGTTVSLRGVDVTWTVQGRSDSFRDRYNTPLKRTPPFTTHDVSLRVVASRPLPRPIALLFEVRNASDVRVQDLDGFPLPGRSIWMEVTWNAS